MRFKPVVLFGVLLVVLGIAALIHPSFSRSERQDVVQVGPMQATVETRRVFTIPWFASGLVMVVGAWLIYSGSTKR